MTDMLDIDYEALYQNLINGNRSDVAAVINDSANPVWTVLRLLREMASGEESEGLLLDVVNLQSLTETRCQRKE